MISESKVNTSDKVSKFAQARAGMKMLARATPDSLSQAFLEECCAVLCERSTFFRLKQWIHLQVTERSSPQKQGSCWRKKKEGGAGRGIKRLGMNLEIQCGNKEIHSHLRSILVIMQRLLSYEALMNSLAKWNVNIKAWVGVKINATVLLSTTFSPSCPFAPIICISAGRSGVLSFSLRVSLSLSFFLERWV